MTTPLPPPHDDELPDETALAALYRQLPPSEPGAALDAAVLHAAAQAIALGDDTRLPFGERRRARREPGDWVRPRPPTEASPSATHALPVRRARRHRSVVALATAASLVLAAGLAWRMRDAATPATLSRTESSVAMAAKPQPIAAKAAPTDSFASSQPAADAAAPGAAGIAVTGAQERRASMPATDAKKAAAPMADLAIAGTDKSTMQKARAPDRHAESAGHLLAMRSASPAPVAPPPPAVEEIAAAAVAPAAPAPAAAPEPMASPARVVSSGQDATPAQVHELDEIRRLFAAHRDREAQPRLLAFHRAHPQWQLEPDLQARLRKP